MPAALTRLNVMSNRKLTASLTTAETGIDITKYQGVISLIFSAASVGAGTSPTLDIAVRTGATTAAMSEVTGYAFSQVTNASSDQTIGIDTRNSAFSKFIDLAVTVGGTGAVTYAAAVIGIAQPRTNP